MEGQTEIRGETDSEREGKRETERNREKGSEERDIEICKKDREKQSETKNGKGRERQ